MPLRVTATTLTVVILDFISLKGTKPRILTRERYDDHPRHFYMGFPLRIVSRLHDFRNSPSLPYLHVVPLIVSHFT